MFTKSTEYNDATQELLAFARAANEGSLSKDLLDCGYPRRNPGLCEDLLEVRASLSDLYVASIADKNLVGFESISPQRAEYLERFGSPRNLWGTIRQVFKEQGIRHFVLEVGRSVVWTFDGLTCHEQICFGEDLYTGDLVKVVALCLLEWAERTPKKTTLPAFAQPSLSAPPQTNRTYNDPARRSWLEAHESALEVARQILSEARSGLAAKVEARRASQSALKAACDLKSRAEKLKTELSLVEKKLETNESKSNLPDSQKMKTALRLADKHAKLEAELEEVLAALYGAKAA